MCGIWGWSGKSRSTFNIDKFNTLGFFNDSRGGDSAGRFESMVLFRGVNPYETYQKLVINFPTKMPKHTVVVGHSRKASVGSKTIENTQPLYIPNEAGETVGVFLHNGTVTNIQALCSKYGITTETGVSDSYYLGLLVFRIGTSILSEYIGSVACMWIDLSDPETLYVFKGASYTSAYVTYTTEDRTLFHYSHNGSLWISSMDSSLKSVFQTKEVTSFSDNTVFRVQNGIMTALETIIRPKPAYSATPAYNQGVVPFNSRNHWDSYSHVSTVKRCWKSEFLCGEPTEIFFARGRYHVGQDLAEGIIYLDYNGEIDTKKKSKAYYFMHGVMLTDKKSYREAIAKVGVRKYPYDEFCKDIAPYACHPTSDYIGERPTYLGWIYAKPSDNSSGFRLFTGKFHPLFSDTEYVISTGDLISMNQVTYKLGDVSTEEADDVILNTCIDTLVDVADVVDKAVEKMDSLSESRITGPFVSVLEDVQDMINEFQYNAEIEEAESTSSEPINVPVS